MVSGQLATCCQATCIYLAMTAMQCMAESKRRTDLTLVPSIMQSQPQGATTLRQHTPR